MTAAWALLACMTAAPGEAGLFLDFDGVLAPIVSRPEDAALPPETRNELRRLVERYALVSVISGRVGSDVRARVDVEGMIYVGSHGLELNPEAERWRQRILDFASAQAWPAAATELKGLTISFHYRNAADEQAALHELEKIAVSARERDLIARYGRKVLEVLPPIGSNKGTAVRQLIETSKLKRALVAGDDTTDLDAFRAVDPLDHKVRVAVVSAESPSALRDAAELVVTSTGEFLELLRLL